MDKLFYHIEILETPDFVQQVHSNMSEEEMDMTNNTNVDMVDILEDDIIHTYAYGDQMSVNDVCSFLRVKDIRFNVSEITDVVMRQEITFEDEEFSKLVKNHIESNLTVDMVLDKINIMGVKSLTDIDKSVLVSC